MDIAPPVSLTIPRTCGDVPCGQCEPCRRRAMRNTAAYILRTEMEEEGAPKAALLDLLDMLGLRA